MAAQLEHAVDTQHALEDWRVREVSPLSPRERVVEVGVGAAFLATAAVDELRRCAGTQFDPRVVEAVATVVARRQDSELETAAFLPDPLAGVERAAARA